MKQTELKDSWSVVEVEVEAVEVTAPQNPRTRIPVIYKVLAGISAICLAVIVYASYSVI